MRETTVSVSLHEGTTRKLYAAEVMNKLGNPIRDVEVVFVLDGSGSLAADSPVSLVSGRTDGLGRATIAVNRLGDEHGRLGARLEARCPIDVEAIRVHLVAVTAEPAAR